MPTQPPPTSQKLELFTLARKLRTRLIWNGWPLIREHPVPPPERRPLWNVRVRHTPTSNGVTFSTGGTRLCFSFGTITGKEVRPSPPQVAPVSLTCLFSRQPASHGTLPQFTLSLTSFIHCATQGLPVDSSLMKSKHAKDDSPVCRPFHSLVGCVWFPC